jgi:hypothetical protein
MVSCHYAVGGKVLFNPGGSGLTNPATLFWMV